MTGFRYALLSLTLLGCAGPRRYSQWSYTPPGPSAALASAHASDVDLDPAQLERLVRGLAQMRFVQIRTLQIARRGRVVVEVEDRPGRLAEPQDLRSTTKSITALLVVDAALRGELDLNVPVGEALGHSDVPQLQEASLSHLLSMRSGLHCDDHNPRSPGQEDRMYRSRDWVAFWAAVPQVEPPGQTARYCTGNMVAAGAVLEAATGERIQDRADRMLFSKIGIQHAEWATFDRGRGTDSGGHLQLTPRDLLRVGQLVLNDGQWQGEPVLHPGVVDAVTHPVTRMRGQDYGLGWWLGTVHAADGRELKLWETKGNGGQHLFILPELDLVVALTGGAYNHPDAAAPYSVMGRGVLPSAGVVSVAPN
ncbi:MAG: serine hydrolase domain-containing protein [Myxococcota bacterium]